MIRCFKKFHYEMSCKRRQKSQLITLDAALADPPPDWATQKGATIVVLGKIKKPGPTWELAEARIVDDRYRQFARPLMTLSDGGRCSALAAPPAP